MGGSCFPLRKRELRGSEHDVIRGCMTVTCSRRILICGLFIAATDLTFRYRIEFRTLMTHRKKGSDRLSCFPRFPRPSKEVLSHSTPTISETSPTAPIIHANAAGTVVLRRILLPELAYQR